MAIVCVDSVPQGKYLTAFFPAPTYRSDCASLQNRRLDKGARGFSYNRQGGWNRLESRVLRNLESFISLSWAGSERGSFLGSTTIT